MGRGESESSAAMNIFKYEVTGLTIDRRGRERASPRCPRDGRVGLVLSQKASYYFAEEWGIMARER